MVVLGHTRKLGSMNFSTKIDLVKILLTLELHVVCNRLNARSLEEPLILCCSGLWFLHLHLFFFNFFFFLTLCVCICVFFWRSRAGVPLQGFLIWGFYSKRPEELLQFLQIIHPVIIMQCTKKLGQLRAKRFCKILWDSHHCNCTKLALNLT